MRLVILLFVLLFTAATPLAQADSGSVQLTPEQQKQWNQVEPGVKLTPELFEVMKKIVLSRKLSVDERLSAISRMTGMTELPKDQYIKRRICIWDLFGKSGPIYQAAMDQRKRALKFGVDLTMVPYTNEEVMSDELKTGKCDAALLSGMQARSFNKFTGTIGAIGALPSEKELRTLLQAINQPSQADKMESGDFVVLGVFPAGTAYIFVDDRSISSLAKAAGKKVAVLQDDKMQARMVASIGATPVPSSFASAPTKFNNGTVDILPAPLVAYRNMELYKGMTPNGGIVDVPLAQITMQLVGRKDKFPTAVAQLIRESVMEHYGEILDQVHKETAGVPKKWWIKVPKKDMREYETMMQSARMTLRDQGYYDGRMLTLERKVRCKYDPSRPECAQPVE